VVDNGSVQPKALALLDALAKKDRVTVLRAPGPFNFSALCNLGARASGSPLLVFLNNDIVARQANWLKRLAGWACRPDIGAVGARLVYPDGRIQAAGDIVGIGEAAANAYKGAREADDYLGQLTAPHEVSAVTGALMVMERKKFETAGGFDAFDFPVSFSDTDLCLKLIRKGWRNLVDPSVSLTHQESASRGRRTDLIGLHRRQQTAFQQRWMTTMRDDPCFHPAFSLWSFTPRLA
jgi:GT2 family glycosyltransferase